MGEVNNVQTLKDDQGHVPRSFFQDRLESVWVFYRSLGFALRGSRRSSVYEGCENKLVNKFYAFKKNRKKD